MKMPKLKIVSELYYPEQTSTGYFLTGIAESLATSRPVNVVSVQPTYSSRGVMAPTRERRHGVDIVRSKATSFNKDRVLGKMLNWLTVSVSIFCHLLRTLERGEYVLVVTNPPLLPFLTALACRARGARYLLLIHDVYPEVLIATGKLRPDSLLAVIGRSLTGWLYRSSEHIIVLGRDMERVVVGRLVGKGAPPISLIPNWGDVDRVCPTPREENALLDRLGLVDRFVVQYSGNMGRTHGLETIVAAAARLKERAEIHFLFCGSGAKKPWLESAVSSAALKNVTIQPSQPMAQLCDLLNGCDVAIISFMPGMAGISVPSRLYNVLAAGKPVIAVADADSELALVVIEEGVGWVVPPEDAERLAQTILVAQQSRALLRSMGDKARRVAEEKYSQARVLSSYGSLMQRILR